MNAAGGTIAVTPGDQTNDMKDVSMPKLSAKDFEQYNHMAVHMDYYVCPSEEALKRLSRGSQRMIMEPPFTDTSR